MATAGQLLPAAEQPCLGLDLLAAADEKKVGQARAPHGSLTLGHSCQLLTMLDLLQQRMFDQKKKRSPAGTRPVSRSSRAGLFGPRCDGQAHR